MSGVVRISREHPPRPVTELWAWICLEENGGEGVAACEIMIEGERFMMPLFGADEARVRSLEPQARMVEERLGRPVKLRRFFNFEDVGALSDGLAKETRE